MTCDNVCLDVQSCCYSVFIRFIIFVNITHKFNFYYTWGQLLSYGSWIYNYLCNLPITIKVVSLNPVHGEGTRYNIM